MNAITKDVLKDVISFKKDELKMLEANINDMSNRLEKWNTKRNILLNEIQSLEEDLGEETTDI